MDARRVFAGYEEAPIKFLPTYKFDVGTSQYDSRYMLNYKLATIKSSK
jgi:hypothetical protein